ncbi:hypothetical protein [Arthrobacter sp. AL12]|uniref:hypothetical protein n=1 Tax=Arthrobacter sp. AL12 TaxID=3042241 RepID=UPI00249AF466|nr:hypothetical protein [Arthrobacter sp. AL12]MDI3211292.1 hypothetical protein [Arthrobacter sp. AL12]
MLTSRGGSRSVARAAFSAAAAPGYSPAASVAPAAASRVDPREAGLITVLLVLAAVGSTAVFVAGYLITWTAFGVIMVAAAYQLTPAKNVSLMKSRAAGR